MVRQHLFDALLIASFAAMATTVAAQTSAPAQDNTPRSAPVGTVAPPSTGSGTGALSVPNDPARDTPLRSDMPLDMRGYKNARASCDKQPVDSREKCWTALNARYAPLSPTCQKLSGAPLDDCLRRADQRP